jgi:hypothetical protein
MKFARILVASLMVLVILAGSAAVIAWHNQDRLIQLVLSRIQAQTGYNIVPARIRLALRSHLVVVLENPRVYLNGTEVAQVDDLRAVIGIHAIFSRNGLPLYALALDHPRVRIPASLAGVTPHGFPKPDVQVVDKLKAALDALSDVAQRIEIVDAKLDDVNGAPLIDQLTLTAYRQHRGVGQWPWMVNFDAAWKHAPFNGVAVSGRLRLGNSPGVASGMASTGRVSFKGLELAPFQGPYGIQIAGRLEGTIRFAMRQDGVVFADTVSAGTQMVLKGKPFATPIALGNVMLHAESRASTERLELKRITATQNALPLFTGGGSIDRPYEDARTAAIHVEGVRISLMQAAAWLRTLRAIPASVINFANRFTAGQIDFSEVIFNPHAAVKDWTARTMRDNLTVHATVNDAGYEPPPDLKLPSIEEGEGAIEYDGGLVSLTQGSANLGHSELSGIIGDAAFSHAPQLISYHLRAGGGIDAGEIYPALANAMKAGESNLAAKMTSVSGTAEFDLNASGKLFHTQWSTPGDYALKLTPDRIEFTVKGAPSALAIKGGDVELRPGSVAVDQIVAAPVAPQSGNAILNGTIDTSLAHPTFQNFTGDLHEIRVEPWLPLVLDPGQFAAQGAVGGRLIAQSDPKGTGFPTISGKLTMGPGELRLGFLRSPIVDSSMTVMLDGKGMKLDLPGGHLEGHPVSLTIALADFEHPVVQLNATNSFLDFEVMKFIRMPWSPKTPVQMFNLPIRGHIEADHALFGKLPMADVNTDFDRMNGEWHVTNLTAKALGGEVRVDLAGRSGPDNHIHIKTQIEDVDAAALCLMAGQSSPALSGRLRATADLWGDTDVDFFSSLGGILGVEARKGTLNRFALVTRVLSFIDLKNWLTAKLPDPRIAGIPFDTLTATFNGAGGDFNTRDLQLSGPVMEIRARGAVRLSDSTVDMEISLIPFDTVNWLVRKIPIIGGNISSGSKGLVAAYFHVRGPINSPSVTPKPITSVAEFVAKTLSLPINIIRPNTINP